MKFLPVSPRDWWQMFQRILGFYRSAGVPTAAKLATVALSLAYILLPVDFLPDVLPVVGQLDDVSVLALIHLLALAWAERRYLTAEPEKHRL